MLSGGHLASPPARHPAAQPPQALLSGPQTPLPFPAPVTAPRPCPPPCQTPTQPSRGSPKDTSPGEHPPPRLQAAQALGSIHSEALPGGLGSSGPAGLHLEWGWGAGCGGCSTVGAGPAPEPCSEDSLFSSQPTLTTHVLVPHMHTRAKRVSAAHARTHPGTLPSTPVLLSLTRTFWPTLTHTHVLTLTRSPRSISSSCC